MAAGTIIAADVFYRVRQADGKTWMASARAWDVEKFRAALAKQYAEAKDGPHVVEFITQEEYRVAMPRRKASA